MEPFPILVSSAGRRGALVGILRSSLARLGLAGPVLAADVSALSAAFHLADEGILVPRQDHPGFLDAVLRLCADRGVRLVVPTHDGELPLYAAARERFAAAGTTVAVSAPETVVIGRDKVATHAWLVANGFATVRQGSPAAVAAAPDAWPWPLVVKPRAGSAAIGVRRIAGPAELPAGDDDVVQEVAAGDEHTVDVLVLGGRCLAAVPRRRIEVRAGEVAKGETVRHAALEALARRLAEALPGAFGVLNVQVFAAGDDLRVIEVNARFGGGYPLADAAGAPLAEALVAHVAGRPLPPLDGFRDRLVMLRYDEAVFIDGAAIASATSAYQLG